MKHNTCYTLEREFLTKLLPFKNEKRAKFNASLIKGDLKVLGVETKWLRKIVNSLSESERKNLLSISKFSYHETEKMKAILINKIMPYSKRLECLKDFLPTIRDWAICDTCISDNKEAKKHKEETLAFLLSFKDRKEEFIERYIVLMYALYLAPDHLDEYFTYLVNTEFNGYYAKMGVAWALSILLVSEQDKTLTLLKEKKLDPWIQNKAIQKARESYRISKELKEVLLELRIK